MSKTSFLIFCTDQMQSAALGCNGHPTVRTPNIDALAGEGATFRRGYCNNNVCMPSRATMITGMTPRQHGLLTNGNCLPESVPTVTGALRESGYRTHAVGKLHLQPFGGMAWDESGFSWEQGAAWREGRVDSLPSPYYGFETTDYVGGHVNYCFGDYGNWLRREHPGVWERYQRDNAYVQTGGAWRMDVPAELHYNHWIADRTIDFLRGVGDEPFFLFCSFPDPHLPFAATRPYSEMYDPADVPIPETWEMRAEPHEWLTEYRRRTGKDRPLDEAELRESTAQTYGMITHVDENVGRVMEALKASGRDGDTVVALIADHGEYLGAHGLMRKGVYPLEPLLRVPFVWRPPGGAPAGRAVDDTVSMLDIVPTVCDYAGVDPSHFDMRGIGEGGRPAPDGRSLRGYLEGDDPAPAPALVEYDEDFHAGAPVTRMRGLVDARYKLITWGGVDEGLLIDLEDDPLELTNLWDSPAHRDVREVMLRRLLDRLTLTERFDTPRICGA